MKLNNIDGLSVGKVWKTIATNSNEGFIRIIGIDFEDENVSFCPCSEDGFTPMGMITTQKIRTFLDWYNLVKEISIMTESNLKIPEGFARGNSTDEN